MAQPIEVDRSNVKGQKTMISPCRSVDFSRKECEIIPICAKEKVEGPAKGQEGQCLYQ